MSFFPKKWYNDYYKNKDLCKDRYANVRYSKALERAPVKNGMNILDIGCVSGTLYRKLQSKEIDCNYICVDVIDQEVTGLPSGKNLQYLECDITTGIDLPDKWADRIYCLEVIEHVRDPMAAVEEICRILKPDGIGVISVPNPYFWDTILANFLKNKSDSCHISAWTWIEMINLLEFGGLDLIESAKTYNIIPLCWKGQRKGKYFSGRRGFPFSHIISSM